MRLSISSWSLHGLLGKAWYERDGTGNLVNRSGETGRIGLLDVPGEAARRSIGTIELCHFHFPSTERSYLDELSASVAAAGVELFSILIDTGDITAEDEAQREADVETIRGWIDAAEQSGAAHVRIIAGDAKADTDTVARSAAQLKALAEYASARGIRTLTENFKRLAARPETCLEILDRCDGAVGLCADFGNFPVETRDDDLTAVLPKADSIHAKADYANGEMDRETFRRHVGLAVDAGFAGPVSLIYQDGGDVWGRIDEMRNETLSVMDDRRLTPGDKGST